MVHIEKHFVQELGSVHLGGENNHLVVLDLIQVVVQHFELRLLVQKSVVLLQPVERQFGLVVNVDQAVFLIIKRV